MSMLQMESNSFQLVGKGAYESHEESSLNPLDCEVEGLLLPGCVGASPAGGRLGSCHSVGCIMRGGVQQKGR